jgi:hypothetical protein
LPGKKEVTEKFGVFGALFLRDSEGKRAPSAQFSNRKPSYNLTVTCLTREYFGLEHRRV